MAGGLAAMGRSTHTRAERWAVKATGGVDRWLQALCVAGGRALGLAVMDGSVGARTVCRVACVGE